MARSSRLRATSIGAITALLTVLPHFGVTRVSAAAAVAAEEPHLSVTDDVDRRQLLLDTGPLSAGAGFDRVAVAEQSLLVYRFAIERIGGDGAAGAGDWSAVVFIRVGGVHTELARLSGDSPEVLLPRPLGFGIRAGDTIGLRVRYHDADGEALHLRVTAEYEPLHGRVSRLAVVPVDPMWISGPAAADSGSAEAGDLASALADGWTWEAAVAGRLLALAGFASTVHGELVLTDRATGAVLWRHAFQPAGSESFAAHDGVVRVGVAIEAGRSYHLSITGPAAEALHDRTARVMVLPAQPAAAIALAH
jgi:hypothetical protein